MELYVRESDENKAFIRNEQISVSKKNFFEFRNINPKDIIRDSIYNDIFLRIFCNKEVCLEAIYDYSVYLMPYEELEKLLIANKISVDAISNVIKKFRTEYKLLLNNKVDSLFVEANKNNFIKALVYSKMMNISDTIIIGKNIPLGDFYELLTGINLEKYDRNGIKVVIDDSYQEISLMELYSITCQVKNVADKISKLNLSPMEKIMYAYDIVKERIYRKNEEDAFSSRDIKEVLNGEYIVCVGYARLFNALVSFLDIKSKMITSDKKNHARNLVYVKDEKYNVDGFLVFDPTFDSRKSTSDSDYIDKYNHFALPVMLSCKKVPIDELKNIQMSFDKFVRFVDNSDDLKKTVDMEQTISELFRMMGIKVSEDDFIEMDSNPNFRKKYNLLMRKLYSTEIFLDDFVGILYNTRRCEYYNGDVPAVDKRRIRLSAVNREYYINKIDMGELDILGELFLTAEAERNNEHLKESGEEIMTKSLEGEVSTERDILNMRLLKVLKKELTNEEK